jgi:microcystin-dependent protein
MATVTKGRTFVSGEVVTPTKLNTLVDGATVTQIVDADIDGPITGPGKVSGAALIAGTVPQTAFAPSVILVPTGAVMPFAMNSAPTGWLAADGTQYAKTGTYATLFAAIGVTYGETNGSGGVGTTHFRVPDLRGYFVRGAGANSDTTSAGTFGAKQTDSVIAHTHSGTTGNESVDHTHGYSADTGRAAGAGGGGATINQLTAATTSGVSANHTHNFTTSSQSPAGATETRPRNVAMLYCIKF